MVHIPLPLGPSRLDYCFGNEDSQKMISHWVSYMQLVLFCLPAHYMESNILKNIKLREKSYVVRK